MGQISHVMEMSLVKYRLFIYLTHLTFMTHLTNLTYMTFMTY